MPHINPKMKSWQKEVKEKICRRYLKIWKKNRNAVNMLNLFHVLKIGVVCYNMTLSLKFCNRCLPLIEKMFFPLCFKLAYKEVMFRRILHLFCSLQAVVAWYMYSWTVSICPCHQSPWTRLPFWNIWSLIWKSFLLHYLGAWDLVEIGKYLLN